MLKHHHGTTLILGGRGGRDEIASQRTGLLSTLVAFKDEIVSQTSQYSSGFQGEIVSQRTLDF